MARRARVRAVLVGLVLLASCGQSRSDSVTPPKSVPAAPSMTMAMPPSAGGSMGTDARAPWGLEAVQLPDSERAVKAMLAAMPTEIEGLPRQPIVGSEVDYGDSGMGGMAGSMEVFLRVMTLGGPGADYGTGAPFVRAMVDSGGIGSESKNLDAKAPMVYAAGAMPAGDTTYYSMMWAAPDSRFVFLVQATSESQRAALIEAFTRASTATG